MRERERERGRERGRGEKERNKVCVCVREREREREKQAETERRGRGAFADAFRQVAGAVSCNAMMIYMYMYCPGAEIASHPCPFCSFLRASRSSCCRSQRVVFMRLREEIKLMDHQKSYHKLPHKFQGRFSSPSLLHCHTHGFTRNGDPKRALTKEKTLT